ncbi:hypothetical protein R7P79_24940, partial [Vibrio sp. 2128(2023)]
IRSYFNTYDDYKSMPLAARKTIAGLPNDVHKHWGWFGSMKGAGVYHSNINNNNEYISEALEHIPLCGEISISQYNQYVRISVIAIARFGLFRSPDPAVFLSSYFYSK